MQIFQCFLTCRCSNRPTRLPLWHQVAHSMNFNKKSRYLLRRLAHQLTTILTIFNTSLQKLLMEVALVCWKSLCNSRRTVVFYALARFPLWLRLVSSRFSKPLHASLLYAQIQTQSIYTMSYSRIRSLSLFFKNFFHKGDSFGLNTMKQ